MTRRRWIGLLAFSVGLNLMLAGAWLVQKTPADESRDGKHKSPPRHFFEISPEKLNLTERQLQQWESIRQCQERESLQMRQRALTRLEHLGDLLTRPDATTQSLQRLIGEMNEGALDYTARMLENYLHQREILDGSQEQELRSILREQIVGMRESSRRRFEFYQKDMTERYGEAFVKDALAQTTATSLLKGDHP